MAASTKFRRKNISVDFQNEIAIIHMKCGENKINLEFLELFSQALDTVERNTDVKALIITGSGKYFSTGLDLNTVLEYGSSGDKALEFNTKMSNLLCRLLTFPIPTIAAVNGHAVAGGLFLALTMDYIIMRNDRGWLSLNEVFLQLRPGEFMIGLLREKVGDPTLRSRLIVFGDKFTASDAKSSGLIQKSCPPNDLLRVAKELAGDFAEQGYTRDSLKAMKTDLYYPVLNLKYKLFSGIGPVSKL